MEAKEKLPGERLCTITMAVAISKRRNPSDCADLAARTCARDCTPQQRQLISTPLGSPACALGAPIANTKANGRFADLKQQSD